MVARGRAPRAGSAPRPLLAALTFVPVMPAALPRASTVNPDASAILAGAVVMLLGLAWERGRIPLWTLAVAGAIAGGTKFTSLLAVGVMCGVSSSAARPIAVAAGGGRADRADKDPDDAEAVPELPGADESISPAARSSISLGSW